MGKHDLCYHPRTAGAYRECNIQAAGYEAAIRGTTITNGPLSAYPREAASNTPNTRVYDVEGEGNIGRIVRREDTPGWFASWHGVGVLKGEDGLVVYFTTPHRALEALRGSLA